MFKNILIYKTLLLYLIFLLIINILYKKKHNKLYYYNIPFTNNLISLNNNIFIILPIIIYSILICNL